VAIVTLIDTVPGAPGAQPAAGLKTNRPPTWPGPGAEKIVPENAYSPCTMHVVC
jgi:hypothetical protein